MFYVYKWFFRGRWSIATKGNLLEIILSTSISAPKNTTVVQHTLLCLLEEKKKLTQIHQRNIVLSPKTEILSCRESIQRTRYILFHFYYISILQVVIKKLKINGSMSFKRITISIQRGIFQGRIKYCALQ